MVTVTGATADEVLRRTETYLDQVQACPTHVPDALAAYGTDREAFTAAVDRLSGAESDCDATLRRIRTLVGESLPPNFTGVFLRADDVVRLFDRIDDVPNCLERFVRELAVLGPSLSVETRQSLGEMATLTVEATTILADATLAYVESLVTAGDPVYVADDVERVATLESEVDDRRYRALEEVFENRPTAEALVVRELLRRSVPPPTPPKTPPITSSR